ncbi:neuroligin-4, X-linked-like [Littorina saxatilis]|uniref:Carboxylesterase type B domain-containing protein n=2 Tax=Littorina saxatilis TaxID=31220 RepID=A0AAN9BL81_9CAEN
MAAAISVLFLILQISVGFAELSVNGERVLAKTDLGNISGVFENVTLPDKTESTLAVFRGIPYAEAPLGSRRFAKPVPKANFTSLFDAKEYGPACPQVIFDARASNMSEDCLYLNVYVPATVWAGETEGKEEMAVMVVVHGGAFVVGQGRRQYVQNLAIFADLIIVTINYRLGPLGFLALEGHPDVTGNQGLYDQQLALKWVKVNIRAFGGDPDRITAVGGSAGAMSVTYQAMFPENAGLFRRFIATSGTALSAYLTKDQGHSAGSKLSEKVECLGRDRKPSLECLRGLDYEVIIMKAQGISLMDNFFLSWAPVEDGNIVRNPDHELMGESPEKLAAQTQQNVSTINPMLFMDAMLGTVSSDGVTSMNIFVEGMATKRNVSLYDGVSEDLFLDVVDACLNITQSGSSSPPHTSLVKQAVVYEYNYWKNVSNLAQLGQNTVDLLTDKHFFVPNAAFANAHSHSSSAKTFVFEFDEVKNPAVTFYPWMFGAPHTAFDQYNLGLPEAKLRRVVNLTLESDRKMWDLSRAAMTYWSNFVNTGNPNQPRPVSTEWFAYDTMQQTSQHFTVDVIAPRMRNRAKRTQFWLNFVPGLSKTQTDLNTRLAEQNKKCTDSTANSSQSTGASWVMMSHIIILATFFVKMLETLS